MDTTAAAAPTHDHVFGLDEVRSGERRTRWVVALTAVFMVAEIAGGLMFGSMALLADGMHMGSHAVALGIAVVAYVYARRRARDPRFSFGVGKVNALAGFTGALMLAVFSVAMAYESVHRILHPTEILFDAAIAVACVGLAVNLLSMLLLGVGNHDHGGGGHHPEHAGEHGHDHTHDDHQHDHNLRSAYLHVLADALTSVTAIFALVGGKLWGLNWLDPVMGIAGSLLVARWSWGLLRETSRVLLDHQAPGVAVEAVRSALEAEPGVTVQDLHVWTIGPGLRAASLVVMAEDPRAPDHYRQRLPEHMGLAHVTIEVQPAPAPVTPGS